ncbi:MAG TPA: hypothetical protein VH744_07590 [Terriglobales bacterium]
MEQKLQGIHRNAAAPDGSTTELTEQEINAYIAAGKIQLPVGVKSVVFQGKPGVVTATTRVDFDQVKAGRVSANPLLAIFSGDHDVVVVAHASGSGGQGVLHVDSVVLDGVEIPRFVLQLFVEKYLQPKYPEIGLDSRFALPERIDTAVVGERRLVLIQR